MDRQLMRNLDTTNCFSHSKVNEEIEKCVQSYLICVDCIGRTRQKGAT